MTRKIESKILGYSVKPHQEPLPTTVPNTVVSLGAAMLEALHEQMPRPEKLLGSTYKLKVPEHVLAHSLFITINDMVLNEGSEHQVRRPFEIFIHSKSPEHYQWLVALTRMISAVFRKGGNCTFLVDELHSVFDPRGGYWNKGKYMPSLTAEIGSVIEQHLIDIGLLASPTHDIAKSKQAAMQSATLCQHCQQMSVVFKDGEQICHQCGN